MSELTIAQRWALRLGDSLAVSHGWDMEKLLIVPLGDVSAISVYQERLNQQWAIQSRAALLKQLGVFHQGPNHLEFMDWSSKLQRVPSTRLPLFVELNSGDVQQAARLSLVLQYQHSLGTGGIFAFDVACAVYLWRVGVSVGFISESEAWQGLLGLARTVQPRFSNWSTYGLSVLVGQAYAETTENMGAFFQKSRSECMQALIFGRSGHWQLPWNTALDYWVGV